MLVKHPINLLVNRSVNDCKWVTNGPFRVLKLVRKGASNDLLNTLQIKWDKSDFILLLPLNTHTHIHNHIITYTCTYVYIARFYTWFYLVDCYLLCYSYVSYSASNLFPLGFSLYLSFFCSFFFCSYLNDFCFAYSYWAEEGWTVNYLTLKKLLYYKDKKNC